MIHIHPLHIIKSKRHSRHFFFANIAPYSGFTIYLSKISIMKNTLFTTIALLTSISATYSQSYRPFVQEGSTWALEFAYEAYTLSDYMLLRIEGDTIYV